MKQISWNTPLRRCISPRKWSLSCRLFLTTGFLLIAGTIVALTAISFQQIDSTHETIENRLHDFSHFVKQQQQETLLSLSSSVAGLSVNDEITSAIEDNNRLGLQLSVAAINNKKLLSTGRQPNPLQFFSAELQPLFHSTGLNKLGDPNRKKFHMAEKAKSSNSPQSGIQILPSGPVFSASSPAIRNGQYVGVIEVSATYQDLFTKLGVSDQFGMAILFDREDTEPPQTASQDSESLKFGTTDVDSFIKDSPPANTIGYDGEVFFLANPVHNFNNKQIGQILLFYNGGAELAQMYSTIKIMIWMSLIGIIFVFISLYLNINRILVFLKLLNRAVTYSISNDYHQPFIVRGHQCCDTLNCDDSDCPVDKDPAKTCYMEVGNRAINPELRNSCNHLQKFHNCTECPVYQERAGDELTEMSLGFNGLMAIWASFIGRAGNLFSGVFRNSSETVPNLNSVAQYLEQMAGLSTFGHDMQGVYSKEEVYSQLQWVFEKQFQLSRFNLLEVNSSENRMKSVISLADISSSHMDVLVNCELCRTKRVAEEVSSEHNPHLCPYFDIDHETDIRCCLPMVMGGRVGAVFTFIATREEWEKIKNNLPIIKKYLDETAPTLASLRLLQISREQALRDPLTKCHNRRFMDEYLVQLEGLNSRSPRNIGFVMADLDHFKMVNDEFGHLAGDEILKQLAEILRENVRKTDLVIRYGGEEFLIVLMELSTEGEAEQVAEKLRYAVEEAKLALPSGGVINKTISMGVAEFPMDAEYLYKAIKYADVALYQAKDQGRNRVLRFTPEMWEDDEY